MLQSIQSDKAKREIVCFQLYSELQGPLWLCPAQEPVNETQRKRAVIAEFIDQECRTVRGFCQDVQQSSSLTQKSAYVIGQLCFATT